MGETTPSDRIVKDSPDATAVDLPVLLAPADSIGLLTPQPFGQRGRHDLAVRYVRPASMRRRVTVPRPRPRRAADAEASVETSAKFSTTGSWPFSLIWTRSEPEDRRVNPVGSFSESMSAPRDGTVQVGPARTLGPKFKPNSSSFGPAIPRTRYLPLKISG